MVDSGVKGNGEEIEVNISSTLLRFRWLKQMGFYQQQQKIQLNQITNSSVALIERTQTTQS